MGIDINLLNKLWNNYVMKNILYYVLFKKDIICLYLLLGIKKYLKYIKVKK